jgi:hypothetical protein
MPKPMMLLVPVILAVAAVTSTAGSSRAEPAGDDCLAKPNSTAPEGRHWYYRVDRTSRRRCWFLGQTEVRTAAPSKRAKPRRAAAPNPRPSVKPVAQATASVKSVAQAMTQTPAEPEIEPAVPAANDSEAAFARRWSDLSRSAASPALSSQVEAELAQARTRVTSPSRPDVDGRGGRGNGGVSIVSERQLRTSYAPEPSITHSEDDMPLIWPVLSRTDLQLAEQPQVTATKLLIAVVAGGLGLIAVFAYTIFKLYPHRPDRRRRTSKRWSSGATSICRRQQIPPTCGQVFAGRSHAERAGELVAAMRRAGRAGPTLAPRHPTEAVEEAKLPRLHERRRVAA